MIRRWPVAAVLLAGLFVAITAALVIAPAEPAEAHALLVRSDPAANSHLQIAPDQVIGFFSEALDERLSSMQVFDGRGERVDTGETTFGPEPERMSTVLEGTLEPGFYTVVWETLSTVDGHLFKGSFPFTILNEDGSQPSGPVFEVGGGGSESTGVEDITVKWLQLLTATTLVGGLAFIAWVNVPASRNRPLGEEARAAMRERARWVLLPAAAGLAVVGGLELLLQADQLGGTEYISDVLRNDWGQRWVQRQVVLAAVAVALAVSFVAWRSGRRALSDLAVWAALAGGFVYLLLIALVSHGAAVPGSFWAVGNDFLHLLSTAVWVGMLGMLALFLLWLRRQPAGNSNGAIEAEHLQRFSAIAATSVVVLLATGTMSGLTQVPKIEDLIDTAYGRALSIKLGAIVALLAIAGVNAFYLRPRAVDEAEEGDASSGTVRALRITVMLEIALAFGVVLAAAALIQHTTARQAEQVEEAAADGPQAVVGFEEIQPARDIDVNLTVSPGNVGQNSFRVFLFPQQGGDIGEVLRVRLRFHPPTDDLGVSELIMEDAGVNAYRGVGPFLSDAGQWTISVDIRRADIDDVTADFPVPVTSGSQTGGDFDLPLTAGSWLTVAGIVLLVLTLLAAIWLPRFPELPEGVFRGLRIGSSAVAVIGLSVLAVSFVPGDEEQTGNPVEATPTSVALGRSLYMANCVQCHGEDGRGDGPLADELPVAPVDFRTHIPYHQDEFFFRVMTNGLGTIMPAFGDQLTEEERWHLLNYLQSEYGLEAQQAESAGEGTQ